jgi:hypothetical protein
VAVRGYRVFKGGILKTKLCAAAIAVVVRIIFIHLVSLWEWFSGMKERIHGSLKVFKL